MHVMKSIKKKYPIIFNSEFVYREKKDEILVYCPKCGTERELFYYNHIVCMDRRYCGAHWCGLCGNTLDSSNWRQHFGDDKCKLYV